MLAATEALATQIPVTRACAAFAFPRSSLYRARQPAVKTKPVTRPTPARALQSAEKETVRALLNSERFCDHSPHHVYATLLDEGHYHCSISTMYRILREHDEVRERRDQRRHPPYSKPELLATAPNQLWSWDISKLKGPATWQLFYLYVVLDIFSRDVVGWLIAETEASELARLLIAESYQKQGVCPEQLTLHADRGPAMVSQSLAQLLGKLGVTKSHARPYTPDDIST